MKDNTSKGTYYFLKTLEVILSVLPLLILIIVRHEKYIYSTASAITISIGGVIAIVVIVLCILNQLHLGGLGWSIILFVLSWFLKNLLDDLQLILLCFMIGQVASKIVSIFSANENERVTTARTAKATAEQTAELIKTLQESGRV